jgi:hypothetical protein
MSLSGILSSPSQRRKFLLISALIILISAFVIWLISQFAPDTRGWNALGSLLISMFASGVFALVSGLFISYFFVDPTEMAAKSILLPEDIGQALRDVAANAAEYKIYVRTGRHFRAEILPLLVEQARRSRHPIKVEVILLDFRDADVCEKYATYRKTASFDKEVWNTGYVQKEVMATILKLIDVSNGNRGLVDIDLFLSKRLSTFRFEGSSDEILVTREDPKDAASRYLRTHRDFSAFIAEFGWIRDESSRIKKEAKGVLPSNLREIFDDIPVIAELEDSARKAIVAQSPYAR